MNGGEEPEYYIDRIEDCLEGNGRNPNKHKAIIRKGQRDAGEVYGRTPEEARANGEAEIERLNAMDKTEEKTTPVNIVAPDPIPVAVVDEREEEKSAAQEVRIVGPDPVHVTVIPRKPRLVPLHVLLSIVFIVVVTLSGVGVCIFLIDDQDKVLPAVTQLVTLGTATVAGLILVLTKLAEIHEEFNSKMDAYIKTVGEAEHAKGRLEGKT